MRDNGIAKGCVLPEYSEQSARFKLTRHLARDEEQYIWHCPWADHWHCTDRPLVELVDSYWEEHENDGDRMEP